MATATPEGIASSIEAHATKLGPAILNLGGAQAAVMGPDDRNLSSKLVSHLSSLRWKRWNTALYSSQIKLEKQ